MASTIILSDNGASSGSAGLKQTAGNDGVLILQTTTSGGTATNAIYVDTSQNVLLGTTAALSKIAAYGSGDQKLSLVSPTGSSTQVGINLSPSMTSAEAAANPAQAAIYALDSSYSAAIVFANKASGAVGNALTERMRINAGTSILCLAGGSTSATGTGIAFPATQSASSNANTLDDYEEGTWTPTWYGSGTAGTPSGSASGIYTKIGNMVTVVANFSAINLTGATGIFIIGGLPFSQSTGGNGACYFEGINPVYSKATVTGSGLAVSPYGGTLLALKPSVTTLWDNYFLATSTFNGGGGSTYGYFTATYFV